jgi:hypothetical protein
MVDLGKIFIPLDLDYNFRNGKITFRTPEYMSEDYIMNLQCFLQLQFNQTSVFIDYHCDDDTYLSEHLEIEGGSLASGDLLQENFMVIQERALKVLNEYLEDAHQELMEHFDKI